jgi:alcohol dehydrogenase class IV
MMGAIAFQKDLGSVHACAHALGAAVDMHHGLANALMIDTVLDWNREVVPTKFDEMARVVGASGGGAGFIAWLRQLKAEIGITGGLAQRGVMLEHLPKLVPLAAKDFTGGTNPRPATEADYERLFRAAM